MEPEKISLLSSRMHEYVSQQEFAGISRYTRKKAMSRYFLQKVMQI